MPDAPSPSAADGKGAVAPGSLPGPLAAAAASFRDRVERAVKPTEHALVVAALLGLAHLARLGTPAARGAAAALFVAAAVALVLHRLHLARSLRDARGVVARTVAPADPELGARTLRALDLIDDVARDPHLGSAELARVHLDRLLARVDPALVDPSAARLARAWSALGYAAGVTAIVAMAVGPFRIVEGLDVLAARHGRAPLPLDWLDGASVVAHPPSYLHQPDVHVWTGGTQLPVGSVVTVRGKDVHAGRRLVLTDGVAEVPFADDAAGGMVARWTLMADATLTVAARFGDVLVPEPAGLSLGVIPDAVPDVRIEGAPRTARLLEEPEIAVSWTAQDDHGLREVDLVLRSGPREERRVLSQFDGETRADRGSVRLRATDPFLQRAHVPVEVVVEARDNDPVTGPKWGRSAPLTLVPAAVGEPEALRYRALATVRDAVVDLLADRIENEPGAEAAAKKAHATHEREAAARADDTSDTVFADTYGGLRVPRRVQAIVRGQLRRMREALDAEAKRTDAASHEKNREATADAALTIDAALRRLGATDVVRVAGRLAEVAEDAAKGAEQAGHAEERDRGAARLGAAVSVLDGGGEQLRRLGRLGEDLGEIVHNDLKRIRRAEQATDWPHAELAARDLAARLSHPSPSFSGGKGGRPSTESGAGAPQAGDGEAGEEGEASREQKAIEQLAADHAGETSKVERAMSEASQGEEQQAVRDEARQRAKQVRDAVRDLRGVGGPQGSREEATARARERGDGMAGALERGSLPDAVEAGRQALRALDDAARPGARGAYDEMLREDARRARDALEPQVRWAEQALEALRKAASERAKTDLQQAGKNEGKLAERARDTSQGGRDGRDGKGALPGETLDLLEDAERAMRDAQRALEQGDGDKGLAKQREAQRLLEQARAAGAEDGDEPGDAAGRREEDGAKGSMADKTAIPGKDDHKGPEAFRRRVLEGLAKASDPRMREAIRRYAEGLLR